MEYDLINTLCYNDTLTVVKMISSWVMGQITAWINNIIGATVRIYDRMMYVSSHSPSVRHKVGECSVLWLLLCIHWHTGNTASGNGVMSPGRDCWGYYSGTLTCSQVSATRSMSHLTYEKTLHPPFKISKIHTVTLKMESYPIPSLPQWLVKGKDSKW